MKVQRLQSALLFQESLQRDTATEHFERVVLCLQSLDDQYQILTIVHRRLLYLVKGLLLLIFEGDFRLSG